MCEAINTDPIKWKAKMKLKCLECGVINKHVVKKIAPTELDMCFKAKCTKCGEANYVTEDMLREMSENAIDPEYRRREEYSGVEVAVKFGGNKSGK